MQLSKPVPWKHLGIAATIGFGVLWLFEAWFRVFPTSDISGPLFALCPPSLVLMAADNTKGFALVELLFMISLANAFLYGIAAAAMLELVSLAKKISSR